MNLSPETDCAMEEPAIRPGLYWTVKESFVSYVASTAGGAYWHSPEVRVDDTGTFHFPLAQAEATAAGWTLRCRGDVRFSGHFGMMFVAVVDPWLTIPASGTQAELSIDDVSAPGKRITIATFEPAEPLPYRGHLVWPPLVPCIEPAGVELFGGAYARGAQLDPLKIAVRANDIS